MPPAMTLFPENRGHGKLTMNKLGPHYPQKGANPLTMGQLHRQAAKRPV